MVLLANLIAMVVQTQSAKLGIATGRNLAELCRENFPRRSVIGLWLQAEVVAMATDVAEVVGAALGLNLLFGLPLFLAGVLAGAGAFGILTLQRMGFRRLEAGISILVGVVVASFLIELFDAKPDAGETASHLFVPGFSGTGSILLATGIIGATVMPHVIYLHSALTQRRIVGRDDAERRRILRFERVDVVIAMSLAGVVNISMLLVAAALFHGSGMAGIETIQGAYEGLKTIVSTHAATIFGVALLASGFASSSVGTMAGQVVMQGFIERQVPIFLRRALTLAPALLILALGVDPTNALIGSQVVLSFGIPFALVPLVMIARRRDIMGALVNPGWLTALAGDPGGADHRPQRLPDRAGLPRLGGLSRQLRSGVPEQARQQLGQFTGHPRARDDQIDPRRLRARPCRGIEMGVKAEAGGRGGGDLCGIDCVEVTDDRIEIQTDRKARLEADLMSGALEALAHPARQHQVSDDGEDAGH